MAKFNRELIAEQLARLKGEEYRGGNIPNGDYSVRLVSLTPTMCRSGRRWNVAAFEIIEGEYAGKRLRTPVWGNAERLVADTQGAAERFILNVYTHRDADGGEHSRVNVEAIRRCEGVASGVDGEGGGDACVTVRNRAEIKAASAAFGYGFRCDGRISAPRTIVLWSESFVEMARNDARACSENVVFLSVFQFPSTIADHQAANDRRDTASGKNPKGSLADYAGSCFAHHLTFDMDGRDADGKPDPGSCLEAAVSLVVRLLELDVAPEHIHVFFSGSKGFHVAIPSALAGAVPTADFHLVTKEFCRLVAEQAGILIDESLYRVLQPLRAPNSRHEKSGLFKIMLTPEELVTLPFEQMLDMARQPRVFELAECDSEPVPKVVALWQQAERSVRNAAVLHVGGSHGEGDVARITRATWDYLLNAAPVGERAESHFKAACNLADFGSIDELIHALMKRPEVLSGLSHREAEAHVDSALKRAATRRHQ